MASERARLQRRFSEHDLDCISEGGRRTFAGCPRHVACFQRAMTYPLCQRRYPFTGRAQVSLVSLASVCAVALAAGCGGSDINRLAASEAAPEPSSGDDGGEERPSPGPAVGNGDAGSANDASAPPPSGCSLPNSAPAVQGTFSDLTPGPGTGGTIVDGLYGLINYTVFTGLGGTKGPLGSVQETLRVSGNGTQFALVSSNTFPVNSTVMGTWVANGNTLTLHTTCGAGFADSLTYTTTTQPTALYLKNRDKGVVVAQSYALIK